jgi:hypothetical protein
MLDLAALFETLGTPQGTSSNQFIARSIPGFEPHRLAKGNDNTPALLISLGTASPGYALVPINLAHLNIRHNIECVITQEDGTQEKGNFSIVRCVGEDHLLHAYFLRVLGSILTLIGLYPSQAEISSAINKLIELFRVMSEPARKSVQGLWAEVLLIALSTEPEVVLSAWHTTPMDLYDFNAGNQRIEVKSAAGRQRHHHFSLAQLQPLENTNVLIASMFMERSAGGTSLETLISEIRSRLPNQPELVLRLEQVVIATLGEGWKKGLQARFDRELAESSLKFYEQRIIPAVDPQLPPTVTDVRFKSDLTNLPTVSRKQVKLLGGLFRAALPRR